MSSAGQGQRTRARAPGLLGTELRLGPRSGSWRGPAQNAPGDVSADGRKKDHAASGLAQGMGGRFQVSRPLQDARFGPREARENQRAVRSARKPQERRLGFARQVTLLSPLLKRGARGDLIT